MEHRASVIQTGAGDSRDILLRNQLEQIHGRPLLYQ